MLDSTARTIVATRTFADGGGTFDAATGEPVSPPEGYAVAIPGGDVIEPGLASAVAIMLSVRRIASRRPNAPYIGTWYDTGRVYVDPVVIIPDRASAIAVGRALGEKAIYDFTTGESIYLDSAA